MSRRQSRNLVALLVGFLIALTLYANLANAQTRNDQEQDRTSRATAQQSKADDAAQDRASATESRRQDTNSATANAVQDKAVRADQVRQNRADQVQDVKIESTAKVAARAKMSAEDALDLVEKQQVLRNTVSIATTKARVEAVEEQSITDRQYMGFLSMVIGGMLLAQWLMQRTSAKRLETAANTLVDRTVLLEAHIAETTPGVIEAYKKARE